MPRYADDDDADAPEVRNRVTRALSPGTNGLGLDLGMRSEHPNDMADDEGDDLGDDVDDDADPDHQRPRALRLACRACGEPMRVRPPKGFRFARVEERADHGLSYRCAHCGEQVAVKPGWGRGLVRVAKESAAVRRFRESYDERL